MADDQTAQYLAQRANDRIDGHEQLCAERYNNIHISIASLKVQIEQLVRSLFKVAMWIAGVIMTALGGLGLFLFKQLWEAAHRISQ